MTHVSTTPAYLEDTSWDKFIGAAEKAGVIRNAEFEVIPEEEDSSPSIDDTAETTPSESSSSINLQPE